MEVSNQRYLEEMTKIQINLLYFLDNNDKIEEDYDKLTYVFVELKFTKNLHKWKLLLHLILNVSNDHYREHKFRN